MSTNHCDLGVHGVEEIYLVHPDGSGLRKLTEASRIDPHSRLSWCPLPALQAGNKYTLTQAGEGLRLRSTHALDGKVVRTLKEGDEVLVLEGPVEGEAYLWWWVRVESSGQEGWVAENPGWFAGE